MAASYGNLDQSIPNVQLSVYQGFSKFGSYCLFRSIYPNTGKDIGVDYTVKKSILPRPKRQEEENLRTGNLFYFWQAIKHHGTTQNTANSQQIYLLLVR